MTAPPTHAGAASMSTGELAHRSRVPATTISVSAAPLATVDRVTSGEDHRREPAVPLHDRAAHSVEMGQNPGQHVLTGSQA